MSTKELQDFFIAAKVARMSKAVKKRKKESTPIFDQLERDFKLMSEMQDLQEKVVKTLITTHNLLPDEAQEKVDESVSNEPGMWSVKADADDIAKYLASDESDE